MAGQHSEHLTFVHRASWCVVRGAAVHQQQSNSGYLLCVTFAVQEY